MGCQSRINEQRARHHKHTHHSWLCPGLQTLAPKVSQTNRYHRLNRTGTTVVPTRPREKVSSAWAQSGPALLRGITER